VTADGYVAFSDDAASHLYATSLGGGTIQDLGALGSKFWVTVVGDVVFAWSNVSAQGVGSLSTWSSASGVHAVAPASYGLVATASSDGSQVLFIDGMNAAGQVGDVSLARVDGSSATTLVPGAYVAGCYPQLAFAGAYALVSHCSSAPGDQPSATITSFALSGGAGKNLASGAENDLSTSAAGTQVLFSTGGGISVAPSAGGAAVLLDKSGFLGQLSADGQTAYYSTVDHAFRRASVSSLASVTLVGSDFGGLYALSADEQWALYYWNMSSTGSDLYMASTATAGTPRTMSGTTTAAIIGDSFTADSSHALFVSDLDTCTNAGTLQALATSGSGSPASLGTGAWLDRAAADGKVVFNTGYVPTGGLRYGRADLEVVDTNAGGAPTTLVSQADAVFALSPAGDQVVYAWSVRPGSAAGVYVQTLP
jgi:hypothetical protein